MDTLFAAVFLLLLHAPDGQAIEINPHEVSSIREPPKGHDHVQKDVHCVVFMTNGKFIGVVEDCKTVVDRFEDALKEAPK
jgi:hypothetical protein